MTSAGRRLLSCLGRFKRDERGVYAIEFALLALPFLGLLFATIEVAWVSFNSEQLQAAVDKAARKIMTGQTQTSNINSTIAFVSQMLCPTDGSRTLPASWDCNRLIVDIRTAADFSSTDTSKTFYNSPLKYCLGNPSTIVVLRVVYPLASVFPLSMYNQYIGLANDVPTAPGWQHVLMGSAVFKTEPYVGSTPTC